MNYCRVCGKKLELTPEYDMCIECQGKQRRTYTLPYNGGANTNHTEMTAKEALELWKERTLVTNKELILYGDYMTVLDNLECVNTINQALTELEAIKSADGSEAMEVLRKLATIPLNIDDWHWTTLSTRDDYKKLENYIFKAQAQERELAELKKSDESKEQSSIDYYNEMRTYKKELEELKKRDTAMKPVEAMITWQCGKCGKEIRNTFNSCPYCRTRIDWSGIYGSDKYE